jgi:hypothetical protein
MTTYKEIKGTNIEVLASDPSNPVDGQVWYNSTENVLKGNVGSPVAAWSTGGNLNNARTSGAGGAGTTSAALAFSGDPRPAVGVKTESYNGTNWTEVANLNTIRSSGGSANYGTQTAALWFSGVDVPGGTLNIKPNVESWNGTSWTEVADVNTARYYIDGAGTQTSALGFGGNNHQALTESWNNTSWTEVADLNTGRMIGGGAGESNTSALYFGGNIPPPAITTAVTESWNGTSWTEVNDLNTARRFLGGSGTQTSALAYGGDVLPGETPTAVTESWNGTSWTEVNDLVTANGQMTGNGAGKSNGNAIMFGGSNPTTTQEYQGAQTRTFTDS